MRASRLPTLGAAEDSGDAFGFDAPFGGKGGPAIVVALLAILACVVSYASLVRVGILIKPVRPIVAAVWISVYICAIGLDLIYAWQGKGVVRAAVRMAASLSGALMGGGVILIIALFAMRPLRTVELLAFIACYGVVWLLYDAAWRGRGSLARVLGGSVMPYIALALPISGAEFVTLMPWLVAFSLPFGIAIDCLTRLAMGFVRHTS